MISYDFSKEPLKGGKLFHFFWIHVSIIVAKLSRHFTHINVKSLIKINPTLIDMTSLAVFFSFESELSLEFILACSIEIRTLKC